MDTRKYEQLIEYIINEDENKARELFHEIVVEKSREIYESIMDEEMMDDMDEGMGGQVGDLLDEINAEEMHEAEESEDEMIDLDDEEVIDLDSDDMDDESNMDEIEDTVSRIEDKIDSLMADFEKIVNQTDDQEEEVMGDEEETDSEEEEVADDEEEQMMEAITLKKVAVTHGDNGSNPKSVSLHEPRIKTQGVNPVKFSGDHETVPTGPKNPSNFYSKGETEVKHSKQWKNAPAQAGQDLESAPKPTTSQASGVNTKSPVNEARKVVRKVLK
jgi:hypothetical protein